MKYALTLPLLGLAMQATAACPLQLPETPTAVPDGQTASAQQMYQAQQDVAGYVAQVEDYLDCHQLHFMVHNRHQHQLEQIADAFNQQLEIFRSRDLVADR